MVNLNHLALVIQELFLNDLDIKFNGAGIEFDLFGSVFKTDGKIYTHLYQNYECEGKVFVDNDILDYISIKIMYNQGMMKHPDSVVNINNLHSTDYNKLKRFATQINVPIQIAYNGLINQSGSAAHIADILNLHKTFVKNIRSINRHNMIKVATLKGARNGR